MENQKYCKHCGQLIDVDCIVCPKCGKRVEKLESDTPIVINNSTSSSASSAATAQNTDKHTKNIVDTNAKTKQGDIMKKYRTFSETIVNRFEEALRKTADYIKEVDKKNNEELIEPMKEWGKFGWTIHPNDVISTFSRIPSTQEAADKILKEEGYMNPGEINDVIYEIKTLDKDNITTIDEAEFCFNNAQYNACVLLMLNKIERQIQEINKSGKTGVKAINQMDENIKKFQNEHWEDCVNENIIQCLRVIYRSKGDVFNTKEGKTICFKNSEVVSRNLMMHGKNIRPADARDCIQLFNLFWNIIVRVDLMRSLS